MLTFGAIVKAEDCPRLCSWTLGIHLLLLTVGLAPIKCRTVLLKRHVKLRRQVLVCRNTGARVSSFLNLVILAYVVDIMLDTELASDINTQLDGTDKFFGFFVEV